MSHDIFKGAIATMGGQVKAAAMLGVTQQGVSRWVVNGYAPVPVAGKIALATGVPLRALVSDEVRDALDLASGSVKAKQLKSRELY